MGGTVRCRCFGHNPFRARGRARDARALLRDRGTNYRNRRSAPSPPDDTAAATEASPATLTARYWRATTTTAAKARPAVVIIETLSWNAPVLRRTHNTRELVRALHAGVEAAWFAILRGIRSFGGFFATRFVAVLHPVVRFGHRLPSNSESYSPVRGYSFARLCPANDGRRLRARDQIQSSGIPETQIGRGGACERYLRTSYYA